jgi:hypothetical protein
VTDRIVAKWPVSVDDKPHPIGGGEVVHVACQDPSVVDVVTVWTVEYRNPDVAKTVPRRLVQVFGTGQPLPYFSKPLGSALALGGRLVWHVFELPSAGERPLGDEALIEARA